MANPILHRFVAGAAGQGSRVDAFLSEAMSVGGPPFTRARIQRLIEAGHVQVDGRPAKPSTRLKEGAVVTVRVPPPRALELLPEAIPLAVLFEDRDVIVIDKPAGLVAHAGAGRESGTLVNALLARCADLSGIGDALRPGIVHRLDKDTTGVLVAAKSDLAHQSLSRQFHDHTITRRYRALVYGAPPPRVTVDARIARDPRDRKRYAVVGLPAAGAKARARREATGPGRHAVTHVSLVEAFAGAALVECRLETGRTHQIRVHLASIGHPIVGDPLYGPKRVPVAVRGHARAAASGARRQMLHAWILGFDHPRTGERLHFTAPLPADMVTVLEGFRRET